MKNIAIIPARGGSKRLPRKNIIPFLGKPVIGYTIDAAVKSGLFQRIIVSTEDHAIASIVEEMGCEVSQRRQELATDTARVVDVLKDLLAGFALKGETYDHLCCLYAASPLRTHEDIIHSYRLMKDRNALFCQSVTAYDHSPYSAFEMGEDFSLNRKWPELAKLSRWDRPDLVKDNGSIYWADVGAFLKSGELHGPRLVGYRMPGWRSVDIDTLTDLKLAEFFAKEIQAGHLE